MRTEDYFQEENRTVKKLFDLDSILEFQLKHDTQIIRGEDYQYQCYINKECWATALTPMFALVLGINIFNQVNAPQ